MSRAAAFRKKMPGVFVWLGIVAVALLWMWFNALAVREFGAVSIARAGLAGVPGTVAVSSCTSEVISYETGTDWTDCVGMFTPADGSAPARTVGMSNTGEEIARGTVVEVRLIDGVAYLQSWFQAVLHGAAAVLFGLLGGIPIAAAVMSAYVLTARAERKPLQPGVQVAVFAVIAFGGEFLLMLLLGRWDLL